MRNFFFLLVCLLFTAESFAQDQSVPKPEEIKYDQSEISPISFDTEKIHAYKNKKIFDYTQKPPAENWWTQFKTWVSKIWRQFWHWLLGNYEANGILAFLIRALPYLIAIGVIGFAIWLFIKLNPAKGVLNEPRQANVRLSEEEKIMHREDISDWIKKALQQKNYRLAVRYYYLLILKKLRDLDLIDYQFQKTNEEYLAEIKSVSLKKQFQNITHIYDFIWYGDFPVTKTDFKKAEKDFRGMQTILNKNKNEQRL